VNSPKAIEPVNTRKELAQVDGVNLILQGANGTLIEPAAGRAGKAKNRGKRRR